MSFNYIIMMIHNTVCRLLDSAVLVLITFIFLTLPASAQQWEMSVDSLPSRIAADGRSTSQITVRVSSPSTGPAPDGTEIRFITTAGNILPVARVEGGKAIAVLTSGTTQNIARITVIVGSSSTTTEVEFVAGDFQASEVMLSVEGDVGYSVDQGILVASDAILHHSGLTIAATTLEFDERRGLVRAQGEVTISKGDSVASSDALWYKPEDQAGALLIVGRQNQQVGFRSDTLAMQTPLPVKDLKPFEAFKAGSSRSWITAEKAMIWPRERIQFTRAVVYANNRPVLALPHYFYDYHGNPLNPISQQFRYTAYEGLVLDLPLYFLFNKQRSAGVRIRYAGRGSSYGGFVTPRKGVSLGFESIYNIRGGGGKLFVDSAPTSSRSFEWNHIQTLTGARRLNTSLRYQPLSDYARNALSGYTSYAWKASGLDLTMAAYGNRSSTRTPQLISSSRGSFTARLDGRTRGKAIGTTGLSWRASGALVHGPTNTSGFSRQTNGLYQTLGIGIAERPIPLVGGSTLTLDTSLERTFGAFRSTSLRGRATLARTLSQNWEASLTWDQEFIGSKSLSSPYRRSLTGSLSVGTAQGWRGYMYLSWIPDDKSTNISASATKPLGAKSRLEFSYNFSGIRTDDGFGNAIANRFGYTRASFVRQLGIMEVSFSWSPQGRDFGLKGGQKFWIEFGSSAF